jgi:hypothetical protein
MQSPHLEVDGWGDGEPGVTEDAGTRVPGKELE